MATKTKTTTRNQTTAPKPTTKLIDARSDEERAKDAATEKQTAKMPAKKQSATELGLVTDRGGFVRSGWADSTTITEKERPILATLARPLRDGKPVAWTPVGVAKDLGVTPNVVSGAISVLVAKGLVKSGMVTTAPPLSVTTRAVTITERGLSLLG